MVYLTQLDRYSQVDRYTIVAFHLGEFQCIIIYFFPKGWHSGIVTFIA